MQLVSTFSFSFSLKTGLTVFRKSELPAPRPKPYGNFRITCGSYVELVNKIKVRQVWCFSNFSVPLRSKVGPGAIVRVYASS